MNMPGMRGPALQTSRRCVVIALAVGAALLAGCGLAQTPPQVLGPTAWRLTVSPIEPAAGIKAEVTMQRIDDLGRPLWATSDDVPPHARARELTSDTVVWAGTAQVDSRGRWVAPMIFPAPGRWQVVLDEAIDRRVPVREHVRLPWPPVDQYAPDQVVRDAIGKEELMLVIKVIPDRGPIVWWLRTHLIEVFGMVVILTASVVSYLLRGRLLSRVER